MPISDSSSPLLLDQSSTVISAGIDGSASYGLPQVGDIVGASALPTHADTVAVRNAVFVVGSPTLSAADEVAKGILEEDFKFNVTVVDDDASLASDAIGQDLIVISQSVFSGKVGSKFTNAEVPLVVWESFLYDDLGMANRMGVSTGAAIDLTNGSHPLAAGLPTGNTEIYTTRGALGWGAPANANVVEIASTGSDDKLAIFGYEAGSTMDRGVAPARRVAANLWKSPNGNGEALFAAAVNWAIGAEQAPSQPISPEPEPEPEPEPTGGNAVFIAGSETLTGADAKAQELLEGMGFNVTVIDDDNSKTGDADDQDLVLISQSVTSNKVGNKFTNVTVPVIAWEPYVYDDLGLASRFGVADRTAAVDLTNAAHPLAGGLTAGPSTIYSDGGSVGWGAPTSGSVIPIATTGNPEELAIFAYETDAAMDVGVAPARRVAASFWNDPSSDGEALFLAAVNWATGQNAASPTPPVTPPVTPPTPAPQPGVFAFSSDSYSYQEDGTAIAAVTITRSGGSDGAQTLTVNLADGTTTAGQDYTATPISVTFVDGQTGPQTVNIPILQDDVDEPAETVVLTLSGDANVLGNQTQASLTIQDDDTPPISAPIRDGDALFVAGSNLLNGSDQEAKEILEKLGFNVTVVDDNASNSADANGQDLIIISQSVSSTAVGNKFTNSRVPLITWESFLYDDLGFTTTVGNATGSAINLTNSVHPLNAGLNAGTSEIYDDPGNIVWGSPTSDEVIPIATIGNGNQLAIFGYEAGAQMDVGVAKARRVATNFWNDPTDDGADLFAAAVAWATDPDAPEVPALPPTQPSPGDSIQFTEVSDDAGVAFTGASFGASWGDYNGDGYMDLYRTNHYQRTSQLFRNNKDGTFTDITADVFPTLPGGDPHGATWVDFDNDGDLDLLELQGASSQQGPGQNNRLYVNEGGMMIDQGAVRGLGYSLGRGRTPVWFDYDNDGLLDVWVANLARRDGQAPPALFKQTPDNNFVNVRNQVGLRNGQSDYAVLSDISGDGQFDIISRGFDPSNDWEKLNVYEVVDNPATCPAGCSCDVCIQNLSDELLPRGGLDAPDAAAADFNNDGRPDLFIASRNTNGGNDLLLMNQNGELVDRTAGSGLVQGQGESVSVVTGDFNNDMYVDIYVMNQNDPNGGFNAPNILYFNNGDGTFTAVENAAGAAGTSQGVADTVVVADYDLNGFLDLFTVNGIRDEGPHGPSQLFRNGGNGNNWIQIDLEGTVSNRDAIGAQVFVKAGGVTQLREQNNGVHNYAQDSSLLHFGLAQNDEIEEIIIRWPSGTEQRITDVGVNQLITIQEPTGESGS